MRKRHAKLSSLFIPLHSYLDLETCIPDFVNIIHVNVNIAKNINVKYVAILLSDAAWMIVEIQQCFNAMLYFMRKKTRIDIRIRITPHQDNYSPPYMQVLVLMSGFIP